ncbi:MAG: tetratricopeptide repeat protein [Candidatus Omnitrophica bacterium]|nr:tetratricopeptide repeat protein [Candidatus Omnitrophota bacterium]MBU1870009.1 tetratricopeptide repeat protein [Candidatus Omnitrophota bacterium]
MAKKIIMFVCLALIVNTPLVFADKVFLKSGKTIEGKIIEKGDDYITIDFEGVGLTYWDDEIDKVEGSPGEDNPANEYFTKGIASLMRNDSNRAILEFSKAIEIDPAFVRAYLARSDIYLKQKDFQRAIFDLDQAIKINPGFARAYIFKSIVYAMQDNFVQAIGEYRKAQGIDPNSPEAALDFINRRIKNNLGSENYYIRAVLNYLRSDYANALQDARKAESLGDKISPAFLEELKKH